MKSLMSGFEIVELALFMASCIINNEYSSVLQLMEVLNLRIDPNGTNICWKWDSQRLRVARVKSVSSAKEIWIASR